MTFFTRHKPVFAVGTIFLGLLLLSSYCYYDMQSNRESARRAADELTQCQKLIGEINRLQVQPGLASITREAPEMMAIRVERALERSELPPTVIARVAPEPASRLGTSDYQLSSTSVAIRNVTLKELTVFSHLLIDEANALTVRDLRIYPENESTDSAETWSADLVLTQLIFSPTSR